MIFLLCVFYCIALAGLPVFWRHPHSKIVYNNNEVTFECYANASNATITITWEKDRRLYTSGFTQVTTHSNGMSSSVTLSRATVANSGMYRCRANNSYGDSTTSNEAELLS